MNNKSVRLGFSVFLVLILSLTLVGAASADLPGSTFDVTNGSLTDTTNHDWNPAGSPTGNVGPLQPITCPSSPGAGTLCGLDWTNSKVDNSFANGPKEDDLAPAVGTGSIPPNKDDLSRFYVNSQIQSGKSYLYLAWERTNLLGSAHMDFEINQSSALSANGVTKVRTAGDVLITFDFGGSGVPDLSLATWLTSGSSSQCEVPSDGIPCWSVLQDLTASGEAVGSVNNANVTDYNPPNAPTTLQGSVSSNGTVSSTFGEAAIDLSDAGIFPAGSCRLFGAVDLKSRSSGQSFTSTLKDFIAPIPVRISNCGTVVIIKHTDPRGKDQSFSYTSNIPGSTSFSLNDSGNTTSDNSANTETITNVFAGSYHVIEGAEPSNYVLEGLSCTNDGLGSSGVQDSTNPMQADLTVASDSTVTCTYTNKLQLGAILITKTSSKAAHTPLAGATFSISSGGSAITGSPFTTGSDGTVCVDHLPFGSYSVQETAAPTGYAIDDSTAHSVSVNAVSTCGDGHEATFSATDTPLTDLLVKATSEASGGTKTTITCLNSSNANVGNSPQGPVDPAQVTANGLQPGTYTCTVVVDP